MTDITPSAAAAAPVALDTDRSTAFLSPADAAVEATPAAPATSGPAPAIDGHASVLPSVPHVPDRLPLSQPTKSFKPRVARNKSSVALRPEVLRFLRFQKLFSQQDMADDCCDRHIRLSIATIKRAEVGDTVSFRTAREFAKYFNVTVELLLLTAPE